MSRDEGVVAFGALAMPSGMLQAPLHFGVALHGCGEINDVELIGESAWLMRSLSGRRTKEDGACLTGARSLAQIRA